MGNDVGQITTFKNRLIRAGSIVAQTFLEKYPQTLKPNFLPSQSNDSHPGLDQKIEIWNSECGMTIAMNMRMKSRNPVWHFFAGVGGGGGKGKGGKFVLCDAKLVGQSLETISNHL